MTVPKTTLKIGGGHDHHHRIMQQIFLQHMFCTTISPGGDAS
jgi:hypothetical protein